MYANLSAQTEAVANIASNLQAYNDDITLHSIICITDNVTQKPIWRSISRARFNSSLQWKFRLSTSNVYFRKNAYAIAHVNGGGTRYGAIAATSYYMNNEIHRGFIHLLITESPVETLGTVAVVKRLVTSPPQAGNSKNILENGHQRL